MEEIYEKIDEIEGLEIEGGICDECMDGVYTELEILTRELRELLKKNNIINPIIISN